MSNDGWYPGAERLGRLFASTDKIIPALIQHISDVIRLRAHEKVRGVATGRVVTFMQHTQAFWHRATRNFISDAMGKECLSVEPEGAIALAVLGASPNPTRICVGLPVNSCPQTFCGVRDLPCLGVMPSHKAKGLSRSVSLSGARLRSDWRGLTATALTEFAFWYTRHVNLSFIEVGRTGGVSSTARICHA